MNGSAANALRYMGDPFWHQNWRLRGKKLVRWVGGEADRGRGIWGGRGLSDWLDGLRSRSRELARSWPPCWSTGEPGSQWLWKLRKPNASTLSEGPFFFPDVCTALQPLLTLSENKSYWPESKHSCEFSWTQSAQERGSKANVYCVQFKKLS